MADRGALEAAAAAGVINSEQVGPLYDFLASRAAGVKASPGGEEDLRFIRNFHDVFLAIGIALFAVGLAVAIVTWVSGSDGPRDGAVATGALCAVAAALMWLLGEVFARRRRLFLPAIAIVCSLTVFAVVASIALYFGLVLADEPNIQIDDGTPPQVRTGLLIGAALAVIAPLAFYLRFRLPFSIGLAGGGVALFVIAAAMLFSFEQTLQQLPVLYLALGVLLFLAGVAFDARDPTRTTRFSDNGFWLHFAAAPLILNGAFGLISRLFNGPDGAAFGGGSTSLLIANANGGAVGQAAATLVVVVLLGFISLLINRRVLIVSALLTTGVAIAILMNEFGMGAGALAAATLITLGGFVLILGAGWHVVRRALLGWVKPDGLWARVFPPEAPAAA